jgi:hypothetical protein
MHLSKVAVKVVVNNLDIFIPEMYAQLDELDASKEKFLNVMELTQIRK